MILFMDQAQAKVLSLFIIMWLVLWKHAILYQWFVNSSLWFFLAKLWLFSAQSLGVAMCLVILQDTVRLVRNGSLNFINSLVLVFFARLGLWLAAGV